MDRPWGSGASIGTMYKLSKKDLDRVGSCWMSGRLMVGDLVLCIRHSGDCFYDYILVEEGANFYEGIPGSEFGSYTLGTKVKEFSNKEYHLLAAGETIKKPMEKTKR